jgi:hypothetical protein
MKTKPTLLVAGVSAIVLQAPLVTAANRPLIVTDVAGAVRILQALPCGDPVDLIREVTGGRIEIVPSARRSPTFELTRLSVFVAPFTVERTCSGITGRAVFSEIGVSLASVVSFAANSDGRFTIPKERFLIHQAVVENGTPQAVYKHPSEDVTGTIDLSRGTVQFHVALVSRLRFRAGCDSVRCAIDEERAGTQTVEIFGRNVFPDSDADGVKDPSDNCPLAPNPDQTLVETPVLVPPAAITLQSCRDRRIGTARATDICYGRPVEITNDVPSRFVLGENRVTWSANNGVDPIVRAGQTVTVVPIACTPTKPPGGSFQVSAADDCGRLTIRLGSYTLADGEVIKIQETGRPGVRLLGTVGKDRIRHFQVGKGGALITAADDANNAASVVCGEVSSRLP